MRGAAVRRLLRSVPLCVFALVGPLGAQTPSPSPSLVELTLELAKPQFLSSESPSARYRITNLSHDAVVIDTLGGDVGFGEDFPSDPGEYRMGRSGGGRIGSVRLTKGQSYEGIIWLRGCTPLSDPCSMWERFTLSGKTESGAPYVADSGKIDYVIVPDPEDTFEGAPTGNRLSFLTRLAAQSTLTADTMHVSLQLPDLDENGKVVRGLHDLAERTFASRGAVVTQWGRETQDTKAFLLIDFAAPSAGRASAAGAAVDALVRSSHGELSEKPGDRWFTPRDCDNQLNSVQAAAVTAAREALVPLPPLLDADLQSYSENVTARDFFFASDSTSGASTSPLPLGFCDSDTAEHPLSAPGSIDVHFAGSAMFFSIGPPTKFRANLPELEPGDESYVTLDRLLPFAGPPVTIVDDRPQILVFASVMRQNALRRGLYPPALAMTAAVRTADIFARAIGNAVNLPSLVVSLEHPPSEPEDFATVGAAFTLARPTDLPGSNAALGAHARARSPFPKDDFPLVNVQKPDRAVQAVVTARLTARADRARLAFSANSLTARDLPTLSRRLKKLDGSIRSVALGDEKTPGLSVLVDLAPRTSLQRTVVSVHIAKPNSVLESVAFELDDCTRAEFEVLSSAVARARAIAETSPLRKLILAQADPPRVTGLCDDPSFESASVPTGDIAQPEIAIDQQVRLTYRLR